MTVSQCRTGVGEKETDAANSLGGVKGRLRGGNTKGGAWKKGGEGNKKKRGGNIDNAKKKGIPGSFRLRVSHCEQRGERPPLNTHR